MYSDSHPRLTDYTAGSASASSPSSSDEASTHSITAGVKFAATNSPVRRPTRSRREDETFLSLGEILK